MNSEHAVVFCVRQGEREVLKRAAENSKNNTVEYCKEIVDTIREFKSLDFCQHFLWVWVLNEQTSGYCSKGTAFNRTLLLSDYLKHQTSALQGGSDDFALPGIKHKSSACVSAGFYPSWRDCSSVLPHPTVRVEQPPAPLRLKGA